MKLLFDENLSPKLINLLADIFPDSAHVDTVGLGGNRTHHSLSLMGFAITLTVIHTGWWFIWQMILMHH